MQAIIEFTFPSQTYKKKKSNSNCKQRQWRKEKKITSVYILLWPWPTNLRSLGCWEVTWRQEPGVFLLVTFQYRNSELYWRCSGLLDFFPDFFTFLSLFFCCFFSHSLFVFCQYCIFLFNYLLGVGECLILHLLTFWFEKKKDAILIE